MSLSLSKADLISEEEGEEAEEGREEAKTEDNVGRASVLGDGDVNRRVRTEARVELEDWEETRRREVGAVAIRV